MAGQPRRINAVEISCRILDMLEVVESAGVTELAEELDLAKSAVYNHLNTLRKHNFVVKDGHRYKLSLRYISMAEHVKDELGFYDVIEGEVEQLATETAEISQFAVEERGRLVYLYRANGENAVNLLTDIGSREMFHSTGLGKAVLSALPDEDVTAIVEESGLPKRTENTITDRDDLDTELTHISDQGFAIDDEEAINGLRCVAAPVVAESVGLTGAISISGPVRRMDDPRIESELAPKALRAANVIELSAKIPAPGERRAVRSAVLDGST